MPLVHALLVADSRAFNFNTRRFKKPISSVPYRTHYIIQRGGTIGSLESRTKQFLKSNIIPDNSFLVVKIALGINNIIIKKKCEGQCSFTHHAENVQPTLDGLLKFRESIYELKPKALITFVTIPPMHFGNDVTKQQEQHLADILQLNRSLIDHNLHQSHVPVNPHCLCWHSDVIKQSKKRKRKGFRVKTMVRRELLYDGIHAVSHTKHVWFEKLHQSIRIDVRNLINWHKHQ